MHEDRELGRDEYVALLRLLHHDATTSLVRSVARAAGLEIAVVASVKRGRRTRCCAPGFYELREGLIEVIEETWVDARRGQILDQL